MNKLIIIAFIFLGFTTAKSQITFEKTYSDSGITNALDIISTFDGGYGVTGYKTCGVFGCVDFFLLKLDSLGSQQWVKLYDGFNTDDDSYSLIQTNDSGFVLAGGASVPPNFGQNIRILKVDKNGNELWDRNYGDTTGWDNAFDVIQTLDNGFALATQYDTAAAILKVDSMGVLIWQKNYAHLVGSGYSIKQLSDSSFIMAGATDNKISSASGNDIFLLKTDKNGDTLWTKFYGNIGSERGEDVIITSNGDFVIAGHTSGFFNSNQIAAYIIKADNMGDTLWTRVYEKNDQNGVYHLIEDNLGNFITVGSSSVSLPIANTDLYLLKLKNNGDKIFEKEYGWQSNSQDGGQAIALAKDGGYVMCGMSSGEVYVIKTDTNGLAVGINKITPINVIAVNVYPNPFTISTTVDLTKMLQTSKFIIISLFDLTGKLLFEATTSTALFTLHNQNYPKGMYLLALKDSTQIIATKKLIIH